MKYHLIIMNLGLFNNYIAQNRFPSIFQIFHVINTTQNSHIIDTSLCFN